MRGKVDTAAERKQREGGLSVFVAPDSCYEPHKKEQMTGLITI